MKDISRQPDDDNPYKVIEDALNTLITGDYTGALYLLENASAYVGRFFPDYSFEDNELRQNIELFRYILNNYPEEFRKLIISDVAELILDYRDKFFK